MSDVRHHEGETFSENGKNFVYRKTRRGMVEPFEVEPEKTDKYIWIGAVVLGLFALLRFGFNVF